ncbi:PilC/PilY family type IV pilus protein [Hydrogenophaga sp.]|uniref:pilus assembly protein n=1 Tax=Hydrogenophaga sp. TaxID=1904254 RepID=UPI0025C34F64|nr:PilC/PilY family type IV pilus protein [Hydrogenophaga sp.]
MLHAPLPLAFIAIACAVLPATLRAAPLNLAQSPAALGREPAPNVIVSVDDSGSMGLEGIATLQAALRQTFSAANVPDDRVRLAWQSMNRCRGIPSDSFDCRNQNGMARLSGAHRADFMNWVDRLTHGNNTPSHLMIDEAGKYLSRTDLGVHSPWASNPGVKEAPLLSCRKSFHIFMTDGAWNSVHYTYHDTAGPNNTYIVRGGNADNTKLVLPDGVLYDPSSPQTRLYRDNWGTPQLSTLSDLAFYYWSRDLQPGLANNLRASPKIQWPRQNFGSAGKPAELEAYWNPRNDPATWQHMVNYTIGFNDAAAWTGQPLWGGDTFNGLASLVNGDITWPSPFCNVSGKDNIPCEGALFQTRQNERKVELWHAALNSRGRFIPAVSDTALLTAFQGILDDILHQTSQPLVSIASSSSRLRANGLVYVAGFNSSNWSGTLSAYTINASTHGIGSTPSWSAHQLLDASTPDARQVLTHNGKGGAVFTWNNLNEAQQASLRGSDSDIEGQRRLNYLRGDRAHENDKPGGTLRRRDSRLGDIANANLWQTRQPVRMGFEHPGHADFRAAQANRPPMLYVGANDGMLHGFSAENGRELMAYVPAGVYGHLRSYTRPDYSHRYFVDGQAFTGDVDISGNDTTSNAGRPADWRTYLVGGLGGGGSGYFVLDVTTPLAATAATSTFNPSGVLLDRSFPGSGPAPDEASKDIGHLYAPPVVSAIDGGRSEQMVKLNNGRWAVVMGNGVNSVNERPVLLIQYLDGPRELLSIVAHAATHQGNGLSAPRLLDVNGDGRMDVAYAGDLQGNLWKFNLTDTDATKWGVTDWSGGGMPCKSASCTPFFTARDAASPANLQPITTAPLWMAHPLGGVQILFGTGRSLEEADRASAKVQTIYSVWDFSQYTVDKGLLSETTDARSAIPGRSALVQQSVTGAVTSRASGTELPTQFFDSSRRPVAYARTNPSSPRGWYMDLPDAGERVLGNPQPFEGQKVIVTTTVPAQGSNEETCAFEQAQEGGAITVLNMITGQPGRAPAFASTDASMSMVNASRVRFGSGEFASIHTSGGDLNLLSLSNTSGDPACDPTKAACIRKLTLTAGKVAGRRADWREFE